MKTNNITLFIPGLWALLRHAGSDTLQKMPALGRMLKRCDSRSASPLESEALLLEHLGWIGDENEDVPIAALERLANGDGSESYWFRADPMNLQEDQGSLILSYPSLLDLELDEAKDLASSINQHFAEDGWSIEIEDAQQWYLKLDSDPDIQTTPYWRAVGRNILNLMPVGNNNQQWQAWLMELQMLLYTHPVNEARVEQGKSPVSGIWLWGGGGLPALTTSQALLRGNGAYMQGVSMRCGCEIMELPDDMSNICGVVGDTPEQLILLEQARTALESGSMEEGKAALEVLENDVFLPLSVLMKSKKMISLTLVDTPGQIICISASGLKKWWRRRNFDAESNT